MLSKTDILYKDIFEFKSQRHLFDNTFILLLKPSVSRTFFSTFQMMNNIFFSTSITPTKKNLGLSLQGVYDSSPACLPRGDVTIIIEETAVGREEGKKSM